MNVLPRVTRFTAWIVAPPLIATLAAQAAWLIGGGEARCFTQLDLDTPGLICAGTLNFIVWGFIALGFHLLLALPLSWWAARERWNSKQLVQRLALVIALLGLPLFWLRLHNAGVGRALWETYVELAGPLFLGLMAATVLARFVILPEDAESNHVAPAA